MVVIVTATETNAKQRHEAFMKGRPKQITRETTAMAKATAKTTTTTEAVTTIRK